MLNGIARDNITSLDIFARSPGRLKTSDQVSGGFMKEITIAHLLAVFSIPDID